MKNQPSKNQTEIDLICDKIIAEKMAFKLQAENQALKEALKQRGNLIFASKN